MNKTQVLTAAIPAALLFAFTLRPGAPPSRSFESDLKLPDGFHATIVAENLGNARHLVVTQEGYIYVKLGEMKGGNGIVMLHDEQGDGQAEIKSSFGNFAGTGIDVKDGYLYASSDTDVFRYKLDAHGLVADPNHPERIVTGLIDRGEHGTKSITLDNAGHIYVNVGAYSNACQEKNRTKGSKGMEPCPILEKAGGIWQFQRDKANQTYDDGVRYITGIRNVVGLDWNDKVNQLFITMHGRDQLSQLYPEYFTNEQSAELPAETMYAVKQGDDLGWPYIYYDQLRHEKILAPEYGGDGKKTGGEGVIDPIVAFPGHLAPNALLFYTGTMFPERYRNGAFIAFHGSWNRAPLPQKGFFVAFVPFENGRPSGDWEVFADNFSGMDKVMSPGQAAHRPCGLAQGPDGALYVSDDAKGTIYKIAYSKR